MQTNDTAERPSLLRVLEYFPGRWPTEAIELALVYATVEPGMGARDWARWLDELAPGPTTASEAACSSGPTLALEALGPAACAMSEAAPRCADGA